jgi:LDH2 family malate/lactate/ureidoglycolate dehydrogenase
MPVVHAAPLERLARAMFEKVGTPADIAGFVAAMLVDSNLKGVDTHGVMQIPGYLDWIAEGFLKPAARPSVAKETATMAVVRGNSGFDKAKQSQVSAVGLIDCTHTGRVGFFVERAVAREVFAMVVGGGGANPDWQTVAPWGGAKALIGNDPYGFGFPGGRFGPIVVDISSSAVAGGKLALARAKQSKAVPEGWILDAEGRPSTDLADMAKGGMQLPVGGHKGYALGVVAELVGHGLLGSLKGYDWLVVALDIAAFRPIADYLAGAEAFLAAVKSVPLAPGFTEVLLPGEPEARAAAERGATGIPIPESTWEAITSSARKLGLDPDKLLAA